MEKQAQCLLALAQEILLESVQADLRSKYRSQIEIILRADTGQRGVQICTALGCEETARHCIAMTQAGQANDWNDHPIGRPKTVNDQYLERLKELVSHSPREYGYPFQRWTAQWLRKHLAKELGIEVSDRHINRLLRQMGLSTRQKRERTEKATALLDTKGSGITIGDLDPSITPEFLWSFNFIKTGN